MKNYEIKEKEWVKRLIEGDEEAFYELYVAYKNRLMYFALRMLKSQTFAEDIFQDTFTVIWQNRLFINPETPFGPYVYTIMKNRILNLLANLDKESRLLETIREKAIDGGVNSSPVDITITNDLFQLLDATIKGLPPQQRLVFRLSREKGLSHKEIAEKLHISVNTVQQHISLSLKKLRQVLEKKAGIYIDLLLLLYCLDVFL